MKRLLIFLLLCSSPGYCACALSWFNGYTLCREITIDHTKVPSTQTFFPALICFDATMGANCSTNNLELATIPNGGKLANASGFDFIFTSDNAGTTSIPYERAIQNTVTGAAELWVKIASLSSTVDTKIYLFYHNPAISTDQSNGTAVWDSNYVAVHHLNVLTGGYTVSSDSTGNGFNFTKRDFAANPVGTSGEIGGGIDLSGSASLACVIAAPCANLATLPSSAPFTLEGWFNVNGSSGGAAFCFGSNNTDGRWTIYWNTTTWGIEGTNVFVSFPGATSGWHKIVTILPAGQTTFLGATVYIDGVSQTVSNVVNGGDTVSIVQNQFQMSGVCGTTFLTNGYSGLSDEQRLSKTERSQDWVIAEFNNQSSPNTFYTVGAEVSFTSTGGPRAIIFK